MFSGNLGRERLVRQAGVGDDLGERWHRVLSGLRAVKKVKVLADLDLRKEQAILCDRKTDCWNLCGREQKEARRYPAGG